MAAKKKTKTSNKKTDKTIEQEIKKEAKVNVQDEQWLNDNTKVAAAIFAILLIPTGLGLWYYFNSYNNTLSAQTGDYAEISLEKEELMLDDVDVPSGVVYMDVETEVPDLDIRPTNPQDVVIGQKSKDQQETVDSTQVEIVDDVVIETGQETDFTDESEVITEEIIPQEAEESTEDTMSVLDRIITALGLKNIFENIAQSLEDNQTNMEELAQTTEDEVEMQEFDSTLDDNREEVIDETQQNLNEQNDSVKQDMPDKIGGTETQVDSQVIVDAKESPKDVESTLDDLEKFPNTASDKYIVKEGDNYYKISLTVCGNLNFYKTNINNNYLKVGSILDVNCN